MREDVEAMVRRAYEGAWNNGDLDMLLEMADPEIVFRTSGAFPDLEPEYRGHEGMRRYWEIVRGPWDTFEIQVERVSEVGEDILILFRFHAKTHGGLELNARFGQIGRMRNGL